MAIKDVVIIGAGVAGAFTALKIAKEHKNLSTILFDIGRPPQKRKRQMEGFLGCLPGSDGKLFLSDLKKIATFANARSINKNFEWFKDYSKDIFNFSIVKDQGVKTNTEKRIKNAGLQIVKNDYYQIFPKEIHALSKKITSDIEENIEFSFDNEIYDIKKHKNKFIISSEQGEFQAKKIVLATGRSGWRWINDIFKEFNIITNNDVANFGIRIEAPAHMLSDFDNSTCSITKDGLEIGPMSWGGTMIPEDQLDFANASFRGNEQRWETDKVSFNVIGNRVFKNTGIEQADRLGQLTFILANERIAKERISSLFSKKSRLSIMPEYNWLIDELKQIKEFMPNVIERGYFYFPVIQPSIPKVKINKNLSTDVKGMFLAGETTGVSGILSAICTGLMVGDYISK